MTKIMLVEDDKSLREIYSIRLVAEGYDIVSAGDGEEALAMAVREKPDLIVSDVMMPKISGFDMLDILRSTEETKNIKIIMMTALSSEDQRKRGESLGADKYLIKSQVGIEDVINAVHEVLGDRQAANAGANLHTAATVAAATAPAQAATQAVPQPALVPTPAPQPQQTPPPAQQTIPAQPVAVPVGQAQQVAAPVQPAAPVQAAPQVETVPVAPTQIPVAPMPPQASMPINPAPAAPIPGQAPQPNPAAAAERPKMGEKILQPISNNATAAAADMEARIAQELGGNNAPTPQ